MDREDTIIDYLQDRLQPQDRASFEVEMAQDASLAAEVSLMRAVRADLALGPIHEDSAQVWDRLSSAINAAPLAANDNRRLFMQVLQYAAVCAIAVSAWQFAVVPRLGQPDASFRPASVQSEAFVLQVKFFENATLGEVAALLGPVGGTITDGPSALGLVRVSFADVQSRDQALAVLSDRADLVEFVSEQ